MNIEQGTTSVRMAEVRDAAFLARLVRAASIPPFDTSFWDELAEPTHTPTLALLAAVFEAGASSWGEATDFVVLQVEERGVAGCAVYLEDGLVDRSHPLRLDRLAVVGERLEWSAPILDRFRADYSSLWVDGIASSATPFAAATIESFAVDSDYRGRGLGALLLQAAITRAERLGATSVGISAITDNAGAHALYSTRFDPWATYHAEFYDSDFPGLTKYRLRLAA